MGWFDKIVEVVETEYDRRIRRASEVIAYGIGHGHHHDDHEHHDDHDDHDHACCGEHHPHDHEHPCCENHHDSDEESAIVMNVPAGTRVPHGSGESS